ncbi:MAG: hypothetical protein HFI74_11975 [Lachnospiraceae bacterium]|nr:hypothetical protein [Lachnospiraceae bacterium]
MNNNAEIDIEIQLSELNVWAERSLFYLSKMFIEQIKPGEIYRVFKIMRSWNAPQRRMKNLGVN